MYMKKSIIYIITSILIITFIVPSVYPQDALSDAVKAYQEENYVEAVKILETEIKEQKEKGLESANLYYNLGNAYFRDNEVAKAILNYERAILLDPGDRDIRQNLEFARTKIEDKILSVDTFFLQSWFDGIQNLQSSNAWAKLSIALFVIFMLSLSMFFFINKIISKKITFYVCIGTLVLLIFANVFSYRQKSRVLNRNTAIITAGSASITSSPDNNSKELFILHSGTKVKINKHDGSWMEIEIDNGNVGWINKNKLEVI